MYGVYDFPLFIHFRWYLIICFSHCPTRYCNSPPNQNFCMISLLLSCFSRIHTHKSRRSIQMSLKTFSPWLLTSWESLLINMNVNPTPGDWRRTFVIFPVSELGGQWLENIVLFPPARCTCTTETKGGALAASSG